MDNEANKVNTDDLNQADQRLKLNGSYTRIDEDDMTAWLCLIPPGAGDGQYTKEEITGYLFQEGIVTGYHQSNLAAMIKKNIYNREIIVARGKLPEEGADGYYEYTFDAVEVKAPTINEDGTVDYTSVNKINNVRAGDKLATYIPARQGNEGYDVRGNVLKTNPVRELPPLRGAGISNRNTPDTYYAEKEGKVELRDGKLDIKNTHEVSGDVDQTIGKVEFFGDVVINGSVGSGVTIRAGRNIVIFGTVEAVSLFAGGDVTLHRGIQGNQQAKISARGSVFAKFIEQTVVTAGGSVFADSIMNSRIMAEGKVILSGKRGTIVGGYTHAVEGIEATSIGNEAETRTIVHVGCEAAVYDKSILLRKQEVKARRELSVMAAELGELKTKAPIYGDKFPQIMELALKKMKPQKEQIDAELKTIREELEEAQALILKGKYSQIRIDGNVYRGTVICIMQLQMPIENNTCYMNYTAQGDMVVGNVIIH